MSRAEFLTCKREGRPCNHCQRLLVLGEPIWPTPHGYMHAHCARQLAVARPPCKHWLTRGYCLMEGRCFYGHPPDCPAALARQHAASAALLAPARPAGHRRHAVAEAEGDPGSCEGGGGRMGGSGGPGRQDGQRRDRGTARRNKVRNNWRVSAFRSWLLDTYGAELLNQGSGVLDVAGGKGELAFELENLNGVSAVVVDPRPMQLEAYGRRLRAGLYNRSRVFELHNSMRPQAHAQPLPPLLGVAEPVAGDAGCGTSADSREREPKSAASGPVDDEGLTAVPGDLSPPAFRRPTHLRMFLTEEIGVCVGRLADLRLQGAEGSGAWLEEVERCLRLVQDSGQRALEVSWTRQGLQALGGHEAGGCAEAQQDSEGVEDADEDVRQGAEAAGAEGPAPAAPNGNGHVPDAEATAAAAAASAQAPAQPAAQVDRGLAAPAGLAGELSAVDREWAAAAVRALLGCSAVVGMHPDQAAGAAARLAVAAGKPFALVPCCVYAGEFPGRRLQSGDRVRTHPQLVTYLAEMDPAAGRVAQQELPFEGKNILVYRL